ncbi:MAG: Gfo/Idh/MocA family oxidoreductase [Phycisphaerales bacterium]|nr:Gfo/Idh/MocA family oxidoreductase [Phycisphaerales bacterium]
MSSQASYFNTDQRIKLGIWGLGRGSTFYKICSDLNVDVVAGCDFNQHMRDKFLNDNPGAYVSDDAEDFLAQDFDAVVLATFCPNHAEDAIRCLEAGKHVLSEVTSFYTMDEGVRLVEAVERAGKVYNLAENYPFSPQNLYLAEKWQEGLFGELMYAEVDYVHEIRELCYTYIDGVPVQPGHAVHHWRSWFSFHYYCTHSLGPAMIATGLRPTRVTALPSTPTLPGFLTDNATAAGGMTPSLITMSNGAVIRNLMGQSTDDSRGLRYYGTLGSAQSQGRGWDFRLGGAAHAPKHRVQPKLTPLMERAKESGHGGGDFWMIYFFAREILTGEKAPFDLYTACDVTIPGILAYRSSVENGQAYDVPDFRDPAQRETWRGDTFTQPRYPTANVFSDECDPEVTKNFTAVMKSLIDCATTCRAYIEWSAMADDMTKPGELLPIAEKLVDCYDELISTYAAAVQIIDQCPGTDGARVLTEMLEVGSLQTATGAAFKARLDAHLCELRLQATDA